MILTDENVRTLLVSLNRADVEALQESLAEALRIYSTGTEDRYDACSAKQPHRTVIRLRDGRTTMFMPAANCDSIGMKIISLSESDARNVSSSGHVSPLASPSPSTPISAATSTTAVDTASTAPSIASSQSTTPHGSLTLLDHSGSPLALLNAEELTAFRTALAATMLLRRREHVSTLTVFGAGKQAYWHIRLALLLRGQDIKHVHVINRSFARAQTLLQDIYSGDNSPDWRGSTKFSILAADYGEYERVLKENVRKADAIFCCTPTSAPLFPAEYLTAHEGRKKGRLVSAIGSYRPHMCELHPDILRQAVAPNHHNHHHKHASSSGVVVVDSLTASLKEAGEVIQAGLLPDQLVEIGELLMLKKQALQEEARAEKKGSLPKGDDQKRPQHGSNGKGKSDENDGPRETDGLRDWLSRGNVIYKGVGLGLMDLVVGGDLVNLARDRGVGTTVEGF